MNSDHGMFCDHCSRYIFDTHRILDVSDDNGILVEFHIRPGDIMMNVVRRFLALFEAIKRWDGYNSCERITWSHLGLLNLMKEIHSLSTK